MRMLDIEREQGVRNIQLYFTLKEATEMRDELTRLLLEPESNEHFHIFAEDVSRELSCSIVTEAKLSMGKYTKLEHSILEEE